MSVARISCPQFLDVSLRSPQEAVDVAAVGVGGNLGHDPGRKPYERLRQRVVHPEDALEGREANLYLLPERRPPLGPFAPQQHITPCQLLSECTAAVGEISKELPRRSSLEHRLVQQLLEEEPHCAPTPLPRSPPIEKPLWDAAPKAAVAATIPHLWPSACGWRPASWTLRSSGSWIGRW